MRNVRRAAKRHHFLLLATVGILTHLIIRPLIPWISCLESAHWSTDCLFGPIRLLSCHNHKNFLSSEARVVPPTLDRGCFVGEITAHSHIAACGGRPFCPENVSFFGLGSSAWASHHSRTAGWQPNMHTHTHSDRHHCHHCHYASD